jgi:hypothetical protein
MCLKVKRMASESSLQLTWRRVGPLDLMWVSLFWIVAAVNHTWSTSEVSLLIGLTTFQAFEAMQVSRALTRNKFLWNVLRLLLCYLLIGFTGGLASSYYILLFLPVVSAAMALKPFVTLVFTVLAVGSYSSFLVFVDWSAYSFPLQGIRDLILRSVALTMMAFVVSVMARARDHITV